MHRKRSPTLQTEEINDISDEEGVTDTTVTVTASPALYPGQTQDLASPQANFAVGRQQNPTKVSPTATDEYKQMIVLSNYRHKRAMWRRDIAANENEPGDAEHGA